MTEADSSATGATARRRATARLGRRLGSAGLVALALVASGCGDDTTGSPDSASAPATAPAAPGTRADPVRAQADPSRGFAPALVRARPGATVWFRNVDGLQHNAAEDALGGRPAFRSGAPTVGDFHLTAPAKPGRYTYLCEVHGFMQGTLVVTG